MIDFIFMVLLIGCMCSYLNDRWEKKKELLPLPTAVDWDQYEQTVERHLLGDPFRPLDHQALLDNHQALLDKPDEIAPRPWPTANIFPTLPEGEVEYHSFSVDQVHGEIMRVPVSRSAPPEG